MAQLQDYLPAGTYDAVLSYLRQYKVHLTVAAERKSILGDYRHSTNYANHRISVNGNLNAYSFLITLLHELAHLLTFEKFGNKVLSHGTEWKQIYSGVLAQFLGKKYFPPTLKKSWCSRCAILLPVPVPRMDCNVYSENMSRETTPIVWLKNYRQAAMFRTRDGRIFRKGERLRKRFKGVEIKTGKLYLFSPVYEVEAL